MYTHVPGKSEQFTLISARTGLQPSPSENVTRGRTRTWGVNVSALLINKIYSHLAYLSFFFCCCFLMHLPPSKLQIHSYISISNSWEKSWMLTIIFPCPVCDVWSSCQRRHQLSVSKDKGCPLVVTRKTTYTCSLRIKVGKYKRNILQIVSLGVW